MEFEFDGETLKLNKVLSDLDNIVFDFIRLLEECGIKYVIISGYVAIFLGRTRTTEDIDIFIERIDFRKFGLFFDKLIKKKYWIINTDDKSDAFDFLEKGLAIRIAEKGKAIPNFEIKFPKKDTDFLSLQSPMRVQVNNRTLFMSPLEIQIPFKLWLGTDKDIEDAIHIHELFKGKLNKDIMTNIAKQLGVEKEMRKYGIG